ncbi:hypothetical protein ACFL1H_00515 [Nanoarchaeota archaeon]
MKSMQEITVESLEGQIQQTLDNIINKSCDERTVEEKQLINNIRNYFNRGINEQHLNYQIAEAHSRYVIELKVEQPINFMDVINKAKFNLTIGVVSGGYGIYDTDFFFMGLGLFNIIAGLFNSYNSEKKLKTVGDIKIYNHPSRLPYVFLDTLNKYKENYRKKL